MALRWGCWENGELKNGFIVFIVISSGFQAPVAGPMRRGSDGVMYFRSIFHRCV